MYNISVVATLQNYNFNSPRDAPTSYSSLGLNITNPCKTTNISTIPEQIENLVAFAGYTIQSSQKYVFNDTESISRTSSTDLSDYCGEKLINFTIGNITTDILNAKNTDSIFFKPPLKTTIFGD